MPRLVAATPDASSVKLGNRPIGASIVGRAANGWNERRSGTTAPSTEKSSDPVPRRPDEYHVSWNVTSAGASNQHIRKMSSSHRTPPTIQRQCWVPLPHCHRPVTVTRSPST